MEEWEKMSLFFGTDMNSSMHIDNKNKDSLIPGEGPTQGLDDTKWTAGVKYPINFTQSRERFVWGLHYNGSNGFAFVYSTKIYHFKGKYSEMKNMHCVSVIFQKILPLKIWKKKKKTGLKGIVKFFYVDFNPIDTNDILDTHKYLMKEK